MRVSTVVVSPSWSRIISIVAISALLFGSLSWLFARDELDGRPFWILSLSALSVMAAVHSEPLSTQAWGVSLILSGGILFLYTWRDRRFIWILFLGILGISGAPFTPAWLGLTILDGSSIFLWILIILSLVFLVFGFYRHMSRQKNEQDALEPWAGILYPVGLATLPVTHYWMIWALGGITIPSSLFSEFYWWVGVILLILLIPLYFLARSGFDMPPGIINTVQRSNSSDRIYKFLERAYRAIGDIFNYFLQMLERDGGILWAALILILILAIFINSFGGP
jgi:hypothetical protein